MTYLYKDFSWILYSEKGDEIARFKSKSELLKFMKENPDGGKAEEKKVDEKTDWLDDEEEIDDEEEEDS